MKTRCKIIFIGDDRLRLRMQARKFIFWFNLPYFVDIYLYTNTKPFDKGRAVPIQQPITMAHGEYWDRRYFNLQKRITQLYESWNSNNGS